MIQGCRRKCRHTPGHGICIHFVWRFSVIAEDRASTPVGDVTGLRERRTPHPVTWVIAVALVAIAVGLWVPSPPALAPGVALGQPVASGGARGVFAFSGQLSKNTYGVYVVDVDAMTMWVYEYLPHKSCLRLAAARTWRYDRYLENHNICDLPPEAVEQMVEEQRRYRQQSSEKQMP